MRLAWLFGLAIVSGAANAQVLTDPQAIGRCLCGQRFVETLHGRVEAAQREYDEAKQRLDALNRRVDQQRPAVDTNDPAQVDEFRRLVREDEAENAHFFNEVLPRTQSIVERYNRRLRSYTAECGGRSFDATVLAQVQATLACGVDQEER